MKTTTTSLLGILLSCGLLFAFGQRAIAAPTTEQKPVKLVYSTTAAPTTAHAKGAQVMADEAAKLSGGRIKIDVHVNGSLFTQDGQQSAIRRGALDMCDGSATWFEDYVPSTSMFSAAYTFKNYKHMTKVWNGDVGSKLFNDIAAGMGVRPLSAWYLGTRNVGLRDIGRQVKLPQDMKGVKLRMPNTPAWIAMGKSLGANPTPIAITETYLALQTGTVDAHDLPIPATLVRKFNEVTKWYILTGHAVDTIMPAINEKKWQTLSKEDQDILYKAAAVARQFVDDENLKIEEVGVKALKDRGLTVFEVDKTAWINFARDFYLGNKEISSKWDMDLYKKIAAMAE